VTGRGLKLSVLTACTGRKASGVGDVLTREDFTRGNRHLAARHRRATSDLVPAEQLYTGQQHVRLMRGVTAARAAGHDVTVSIASAGYGLVAGQTRIAPYECTFRGMSRAERRAWARNRSLPEAVDTLLARPADLAIVLLGEDYFDACGLGEERVLGAPTLLICGARTAMRLSPDLALRPLVLHREDTRRFSCGQVGLKGEIARRLLALLAATPGVLPDLLEMDLVRRLASKPTSTATDASAI
jgi:hypothetical protein